MNQPDVSERITPEEEALLKSLAMRQRESEASEAKVLAKYASRAELIKQIWTIVFACGTAIVFGTIYVLHLQTTIERNSAEISALQTQVIPPIQNQILKNIEMIQQLRLDMKDKVDRNKP